MTNLDTSSALNLPASIATLQYKLRSEPEKVQLQVIDELLAVGETGFAVLMEFLLERQPELTQSRQIFRPVEAKIYQALFTAQSSQVVDFLAHHFPRGIVPLRSQHNLDYAPLQKLLAEQAFEAADRFTLEKLCELAGNAAMQRKWIYFTEVENFSVTDLQTMNVLWLTHSEGKFGFSVQRELWLGVGKNWEKLWSKIGWKSGNNWTRYPEEFTWNLTAPRGHLPLSNQLRGVRVIAALLAHPAWFQ
jgi:GUN4-like/ARM-like repeat domain, GUN4-N terminal